MSNTLHVAPVFLLILFVALQIADVGTTYFIIKRDIGHESNPAMAWLIGRIGLVAGLGFPKAVIVLLLYLLVLPAPHVVYVLGALVALYAWVVLNNLSVIRRART